MAKELIKHPGLDNNYNLRADYLTPAYCDVTLSLKPITKYSKNSLLRFLRGQANVTDRMRVAAKMVSGMKAAKQKLGRPVQDSIVNFEYFADVSKHIDYTTVEEGADKPKSKSKGKGRGNRGRKRGSSSGSRKRGRKK